MAIIIISLIIKNHDNHLSKPINYKSMTRPAEDLTRVDETDRR